MAELVKGGDVATAWVKACQVLRAHGRRVTNLVVVIENAQTENGAIRKLVDNYFNVSDSVDTGSVDGIADTIFPWDFYDETESASEQTFYERWKLAREFESHSIPNGDYFGRMISYPGREKSVNQLARVVKRLRWATDKGVDNANQSEIAVSSVDLDEEIRIQDPETDGYTMGFPCLSHISVTLQDRKVHLSATYRSQDFALKAYGNFAGLARLQQFLVHESKLELGEIVCIATCATLPSRGQIIELVKQCELLLPVKKE